MTAIAPYKGASDPRLTAGAEQLAEAQFNGYPQVVRRSRDRSGLALGGGVAALLGAATFFSLAMARTDTGQHNATTQPSSVTAGNAPQAAAVTGETDVSMPSTIDPAATQMPMSETAMSAVAVPPVAGADGQRPATLIFDGHQTDAAPAEASSPMSSARAAMPRASERDVAEQLSPEEQFVRRIAGTDTEARATQLRAPASTVVQGTLIAAVLETSVNSDLPGFVRAVISRDVRSFDGSRVLIPRGSHVIGEYKSSLAVGQTRAFVLWTRLLRPDGVSIALGSPATDAAGENGLSGKVQSHFGKRFGMALLLSLINAGGQAIGGGGSVVIAGSSQVMSPAAQRDLNIPPTVKVKVGTRIGIFVARDLDFSIVESGQ